VNAPVWRIARHELLLLRRNPKALWSNLFGLLMIGLIFVNAIREGAPRPALMGMFLMLIFFASAASPLAFAIHSFVGERERRTLEQLLVLPLCDGRLPIGLVVDIGQHHAGALRGEPAAGVAHSLRRGGRSASVSHGDHCPDE
jgi:hypothetical protein